MKNVLLVALIVSICANVGLVIYHNSKTGQWQTALTGWQEAVTERDTLLDKTKQELVACQTPPTPTPAPVVSDADVMNQIQTFESADLQHDREAAAAIVAALERIVAATTSGVNYQRYLQLTEDLVLAIQRQQSNPLQHQAYREAITESARGAQQAGKLWTACLDEAGACATITIWAIQTYQMPFKGEVTQTQKGLAMSVSTAKIYMDNTLSFLWNITRQRLNDANAIP